jgi:glycosyltransferase involved in cell wall biosynthesis
VSLRILWASNAPWARSGYGVQGKYIVPGFRKLGHDVAIFAWWGSMGGIMEWSGHHGEYKDNPFVVYPMWADPYGCDVARNHADHYNADLVISLVDLWVQKGYADSLPSRWVPYFPIDSAPVPEDIYGLAKRSVLPITYSRWGQEELKKVGVEADFVPHGVGDAFRPNLEAGKQWRKETGIPEDAFLVGGVWANKGFPSRKNFDGHIRAFKEFAKRHDDALFYIHSEPSCRYGGVDLWRLVKEAGLYGKVIVPDSYQNLLGYEESWMGSMYNALDVYCGATCGEGYGLPIGEAQACGVPVICTNYSSMPELVDSHKGPSYKVKVAEWDLCPLHSYFAKPDTEDIINGLEIAYKDWRGGKPFKELVTWGEQWYWDRVIEDWWGPALRKIEGKLNRLPWLPGEHPVLSSRV